MKKIEIREPIRLRQKPLSNGGASLYLDKFINGKRKYEFLKLYLVPEQTKADKEKNRQTWQLADAIRSRETIELQNRRFGFSAYTSDNVYFFPYFESQCENGARSEMTHKTWLSCLAQLKKYDSNEKLTLSSVTHEWVKGWRDYLDKNERLSEGSKGVYWAKLVAIIHQAVTDGLLPRDPTAGVKGFRHHESTRMYLTVEEVRQLAKTDCHYPRLKEAFLFSCLTGLRCSDVEKLTWGDIYQQGDMTRIIFRQKKTHGQEYLDITPQAAQLLGTRGTKGETIFTPLPCRAHANNTLRQWVAAAGITKHISFHCARHTFAVMMLDLGTDIYTVSKLLGHREIKTTQIYAKVLDKAKQDAVRAIPSIL